MRQWIVACLWLCVVSSAGSVAAQEMNRNSPEYKEAIRKALQEYELGNWEEAKLFFSDAHRMFPNARTLRGLALTTYALRDYVSATQYFEQAIEHKVQPLSAELRSGASEFLEQARRFVAHLDLVVEPSTAEVQIDGRPVVRGPDGKALLNPGTHELVASAPDRETVSRRWSVEAGARTRLDIVLPQPAPQSPPPVAAGPVEPTGDRPITRDVIQAPEEPAESRSVAPWILVSVSGAAAITGGVLLGMTVSDIGSVEDAQKNTEWSSVKSAYDRVPVISTVGFVMLGVGLAGVAAGLTWQFWPEENSQAYSLDVSPTGAALRGTF